jgi:hypothetical protein
MIAARFVVESPSLGGDRGQVVHAVAGLREQAHPGVPGRLDPGSALDSPDLLPLVARRGGDVDLPASGPGGPHDGAMRLLGSD